jgi:DNA-binding CsgD family transcriptional regulator/tetratricopeptide (TPR) repeat protein
MASDLPLIARDRELSAVTAVIESAADGRGQGVLITGEAGIGKTRLLREARTGAEQQGLLVLTGRAVESGGGAYRPLVEAFGRPAAPFASHPDLVGVRPALARVLPGWVAETSILAPMADPTAVLATALMLLLQTMAPNGAVLILDDLQWADPDTVSTLTSLVDSIDSMPLALVAAARGETPTEAAVHQLGGRGSIRVLPLQRLTPTEVGEALRANQLSQLPAEQVEQLVSAVDGLPLIMDEFIRQIQEGDPEVVPGGLTSSTLSSAVQLRLAGLSSDCRMVLDALSVIGDTEPEILIATTGLDAGRLGQALHLGLASTLLVPSSNSLGAGWRHILISEAIRDLLLPLEKQALALGAADRLTEGDGQNDGQLSQAAHLYELAGHPHRAAEPLLRAARLAVTHAALDLALQYLSDAQRLTGDIPDTAHRVLIERIETLALAGRVADAYDSGMTALNDVASANLRPLLAATTRAAIQDQLAQQSRELLARLERETETADADLMLLRAHVAVVDRRPETLELGLRAAAQARQEGRIEIAAEALSIAGWGAIWLGSPEEAAKAFREALQLSRQHTLPLWEIKAIEGLAVIDEITDHDPTGIKETRRLATTAGMVGMALTMDSNLAWHELWEKGFLAAYPGFLRVERQARQLRINHLRADAYLGLLYCCLLAEQPIPDVNGSQQSIDIESAIAQAKELEKTYKWFDGVNSALGARAWLHGDSATAIRLIDDDLRQFDDKIKFSPWWGFARLLRVVNGEDPSQAFDRVNLTGDATNWAARAFGTALGRLRTGQPADAALAEAALAEAQHHLRNTPFWGHLLRTVTAPAAFQTGMRTKAEGWLREADAFFAAAGEHPSQRRVRQTLAAIGLKVPRTAAYVPPHLVRFGITTREVEILQLVNAGLTNGEIAEQLFISSRTVETHISSMLQKTGAQRRDQLPSP